MGKLDKWMGSCDYGQMNGLDNMMHGWVNEVAGMERWMNGKKDGGKDGWIDRRTEING